MVAIPLDETTEADVSIETTEADENLYEEEEEYFLLGLVTTKEDIKKASNNLSTQINKEDD